MLARTELRALAPRRQDLDAAISRVEQALSGLHHALRLRDAHEVEAQATGLQAALVQATAQYRRLAHMGEELEAARSRLSLVRHQLAAQRNDLARAGAALDRAVGVLTPLAGNAPALYGASGRSRFASPSDLFQA